MGLARSAINLLLQEAARRPFSGSVATLGRQHVYATYDDVVRLSRQQHVPLAAANVKLHREAALARQNFISDESLYELLGFSRSVRIDYSDFEAPDELLDLNCRETPDSLRRQFDVVLDSGTIEHVFDIAAALGHCVRMVRPGGRIVHLSPTSNCVDHGFYSVSPTLFADYYHAAGFELNTIYLCRWPHGFERQPWQIYDYLSRDRSWLPLGRMDGGIWFTFAVVTAAAVPRDPSIVNQSYYEQTWHNAATTDRATSAIELGDEPAHTRSARLLRFARHIPGGQAIARKLIVTWRKFVNQRRERQRGRIPFAYRGRC